MKKIFFFFLASCFSYFSYGQKYMEESNISSSFKTDQVYKISILPIVSNDVEASDEENLLKLAYNELNIQLTSISNFQVISSHIMEEALNNYRFGGGLISASEYGNIAKAVGADLLLYCELSRDMGIFKKKEVSTILAYVQIFDVKNNFIAIYTAKARSINPLSKQSEVEIASAKALKKLVEKMKKSIIR